MKKGKVFGKGQAILALMVLALGAAVWLNVKFSSDEKFFGQATYVGSDKSENAVETSAKVKKEDTDYFESAKKERNETLKKSQSTVESLLDTDKLTDDDKQKVMSLIGDLTQRREKETNIEALLKAKGFEKSVAVIGDKGINIVVKSDGLTTAQTLQIQDIVTSESDVPLANIKIVAVK